MGPLACQPIESVVSRAVTLDKLRIQRTISPSNSFWYSLAFAARAAFLRSSAGTVSFGSEGAWSDCPHLQHHSSV